MKAAGLGALVVRAIESTLDGQELAVYLVLLKHRDATTGECWPGLATISDESRLSRDTVIRTLSRLEAHGLVAIQRRRQRMRNLPNLYRVAPIPDTMRATRGERVPRRRRVVAPSDHPRAADAVHGVVAPSDQVVAPSGQGSRSQRPG